MASQIFVYCLHQTGKPDDTALELARAAAALDPQATTIALVFGTGPALDAACGELTANFEEVWKIDDASLAYPNAEIIREMLVRVLPKGGVVLAPHEHFGMDLAPGLSIRLDAAFLPDAMGIVGLDANRLKAVRQEYSGQVSTHVDCDISGGIVITVRPGAFKSADRRATPGQVVDKSAEALAGGLPAVRRRFLEVVEPEAGDVDITQADVLVSVGRGIEDADNLELVFELAQSMGAEVSCSRPIVDAKWLEKARQVGTSGKTVKPKVYLALGISGSFQHLGGLKGAPFVVAINKNAKAPIFQVADVGVVEDILEFIPALTEKLESLKG